MLNLVSIHATINMNDPNSLSNYFDYSRVLFSQPSNKILTLQTFIWKAIRSAPFSETAFDTINQGFYEDITMKVMIPLHRRMTSAIDLILHE